MKPVNLISLSLKESPELAEMLKEMQPGDTLDLTLTNGTGEFTGKVVIDELLADRVAGQLITKDEEDDVVTSEPPAPAEMGASILGVMAGVAKG